jgi:hypothetical protein
LLAENNEKAIVENKRKDLSDALTFLEEKKSEVEAAIKKLGETEELSEALNIIAEELKSKEKELADSYSLCEATNFVKEFKKYGDFKYDRNDGSSYLPLKSSQFGTVSIRLLPEDKADEILDDTLVIGIGDLGKGITLTGLKNIKDWFNGGGLDMIAYSSVKDIEKYNDKFNFNKLEENINITEKKSKDDYLNDGYVEASVVKTGQGLKKDQEVLVSAEEYASLGDDDLLTIMIPKTGKTVVLPKADLSVKI